MLLQVRAYEDPSLQAKARSLIPLTTLQVSAIFHRWKRLRISKSAKGVQPLFESYVTLLS